MQHCLSKHWCCLAHNLWQVLICKMSGQALREVESLKSTLSKVYLLLEHKAVYSISKLLLEVKTSFLHGFAIIFFLTNSCAVKIVQWYLQKGIKIYIWNNSNGFYYWELFYTQFVVILRSHQCIFFDLDKNLNTSYIFLCAFILNNRKEKFLSLCSISICTSW